MRRKCCVFAVCGRLCVVFTVHNRWGRVRLGGGVGDHIKNRHLSPPRIRINALGKEMSMSKSSVPPVATGDGWLSRGCGHLVASVHPDIRDL